MPKIKLIPLTPDQSARLAEVGAELLVIVEGLTMTCETVAHLRGLERDILPMTDKARELIARVKG
jgi:hypothetical protein